MIWRGEKSVNLKNIIYGNKLIFKTLDPNNYRFIYKKNSVITVFIKPRLI